MKATIEATGRIMDIRDTKGRPAQVRVFEGTTESGIRFTAFVAHLQLLPSEEERRREFEDELLAHHPPPSDETLRAIAKVRR